MRMTVRSIARGPERAARDRPLGVPEGGVNGTYDRGAEMLSEQEATRITQVAAILGLAVGLLAVAV